MGVWAVGVELSFFGDGKVIWLWESIADTSPEGVKVDVEWIEGGFIVPFHTVKAEVVRLRASDIVTRH